MYNGQNTKVWASSGNGVNLGARQADEAKEVVQGFCRDVTPGQAHRTGNPGQQSPSFLPPPILDLCSLTTTNVPVQGNKEGKKRNPCRPYVASQVLESAPPPGVQFHHPSTADVWLASAVCQALGTRLTAYVLFCEASPAPLGATWSPRMSHPICPVLEGSPVRGRVCIVFIAVPLSPAQGLGQDLAGAPLRLLSEMEAEEGRKDP